MTETREAIAVHGTEPMRENEYPFTFRVGQEYRTNRTVTRITVAPDLPGPMAMLERVRIYDGETVIGEMPLHMCELVEYAAPEGGVA